MKTAEEELALTNSFVTSNNKLLEIDAIDRLVAATGLEYDAACISNLIKTLHYYKDNHYSSGTGPILQSRDPLELGIEVSTDHVTSFKYTFHSQKLLDASTTNLNDTAAIMNTLCDALAIDSQYEVNRLLNFISSQTETGITSVYCSVTHKPKNKTRLRLYLAGGIEGIAFSFLSTLSREFGLPKPPCATESMMAALCATHVDIVGLDIGNNGISGLKLYISKPYFHAGLLKNIGREFQPSLRGYLTLFQWYRCFVSRAFGRVSIFGVGVDLTSTGRVSGVEIYNYSDSDLDNTWLPRLKRWSSRQAQELFMTVLNDIKFKPIGISVGLNLATNENRTTLYLKLAV